MSVPPNRPQDSSVMLALNKLSLVEVLFETSPASTAFAGFMSRMTIRALVLGEVWASGVVAAAAAAADLQRTKRILSEIQIPPVNQLELTRTCRIAHFKAALEAGTTSLIELHVHIVHGNDDYTERLELLTNFIRRAVQLNSLTIHTYRWRNQPITLQREFLLAIEACATVTRILVNNGEDMRQFTTRNEELARLVAIPSSYPNDKLLGLMRQFDNCPTGRYMLVHCLPEVFSFQKGSSLFYPTTEPKPKKRKIS